MHCLAIILTAPIYAQSCQKQPVNSDEIFQDNITINNTFKYFLESFLINFKVVAKCIKDPADDFEGLLSIYRLTMALTLQ